MKRQVFRFPLNLQLFAEGGEGGAAGGAVGGAAGAGASGGQGGAGEGGGQGGGQGGQGGAGAGEGTTFSQADLDRILGDRLGKERLKWEKDFNSKLEAAKTEAEKLAKMNAEQKADYERQQRDDALAKREGEITRRELRATALETLAEKSLPKQLADILDYTDAEATNKSIESVGKAFSEAVQAAVNERLKGDTPKGGAGGGGGASKFADIEKIFQQR